MAAIEKSKDMYARGIGLSALGMLAISPDGLLFRLIEVAGPWEVAFWRSLFTGCALFALLLGLKGRGIWAAFRGLGRRGALSVLLLTVTNLSFVGAITHTSVANTLILLATMPFFGAVLGWVLIGERVRLRTWAAIAVATTGIGVIVSGGAGTGIGFGTATFLGDGLALLTALVLALNLVLLRTLGDGIILPAVTLSGFGAAAVAFFFASPTAVSGTDLGIIAVMGGLVQSTGLILFLTGTKFVPAAEVAILALVETVLGPLWAWVGVGEAPGRHSLLGGAIVIGAILFNAGLSVLAHHRRNGAAAKSG